MDVFTAIQKDNYGDEAKIPPQNNINNIKSKFKKSKKCNKSVLMDRGKQKQRRRSQDEFAVHREGLWRWDLVGLLPCVSRALDTQTVYNTRPRTHTKTGREQGDSKVKQSAL